MEPEADGDGTSGAAAAPGLRVLRGEKLLGVVEDDLDGPPIIVVRGDIGGVGGDVGGEEEVVVLVASGIANDDQE